MLISTEKIPDQNIVVITYAEPFELEHDILEAQGMLEAMQEIYAGDFCRIDDVSGVGMSDDEIKGMIHATTMMHGRGVLVADDHLLQKAVHFTNMPLFHDISAALNFAREAMPVRA